MRKASELIFAIKRDVVAEGAAVDVRAFETFFYGWLERAEPTLLQHVRDATVLSPALRDALARAVQDARRERGGIVPVVAADDSYREAGGEA